MAGGIYSWGDAMGIFLGKRSGIIIADTAGHIKHCGDKMNEFLQKQIMDGWGTTKPLKEEFRDLSERIALEVYGGKEWPEDYKPDFLASNWWECGEYNCAQLYKNELSIVGLESTILRGNKDIERPSVVLGLYSTHINDKKRVPFKTELNSGDVLLIASDGLGGSFCNVGDRQKIVEELLKENSRKSAQSIRDFIIRKEKYYYPCGKFREFPNLDLVYDDITFAIIKKD